MSRKGTVERLLFQVAEWLEGRFEENASIALCCRLQPRPRAHLGTVLGGSVSRSLSWQEDPAG